MILKIMGGGIFRRIQRQRLARIEAYLLALDSRKNGNGEDRVKNGMNQYLSSRAP
jgi:hypothetical protein